MFDELSIPTWPFVLALILMGGLILLGILLRLLGLKTRPGYRLTHLLTPAELSFYGVLTQPVGEDWRVFSKVRLADVITPEKGLSRSRWQSAFNAISSKHLDFLLCDPADCSPSLAVELDDKSHQRRSRQKRDRLVDDACQSAGLPLLRIKAARTYVVADLRRQIEDALTPTESEESSPRIGSQNQGERREPTF